MKKKKLSQPPKPRQAVDSFILILIALLLVCLPFIVSFTGFEKFRLPKDVVAAVSMLAITMAFVVSRKLEVRFRPRTWEFFLGLALVYTALHSFLSQRPDVSLAGFARVVYFCALLLLLTEVLSESFQKKLWLWIAASSGVNASLTIFQYFGLFPLMTKPGGEVLEGRLNPSGLIGDVNTGGFLFGLVCLVLLYAVWAEKSRKVQVAGVVLLFVNLLGLAFTRTLTAIIALLCCLLVWLVFHHWWVLRTTPRITRQLVYFWTVLVLGMGAAGAVVLKSGIQERLRTVWSQVQEGDWTEVTAGRQPVYQITWEMIRDRPWAGHGLNTFGLDFFHYRAGTEVGQSVDWLVQSGTFREAHNEYLQIWEELGIVGLLFFLVLLLGPLLRALPILRAEPDSGRVYWIGVLCLGLLFVAISSFSHFPLHVSTSAAYVVLVLAGLRHFQNPERTAHAVRREGSIWKLLLFSALGAWLAYPHIQKWQANTEMGLAESMLDRALQPQVTADLRAGLIAAASQKLDRAQELCPQLYEIYHLKGSALVLSGKLHEAAHYYGKAAFYLPSPEVYTNLGGIYLLQKDAARARPLFEIALRYNPGYLQARRGLEYVQKLEQETTDN